MNEMERLTRKIERDGFKNKGRNPSGYTSNHTTQEVVGRLAAYEDIGTAEEFAALKQAENEGRLVELPRKVGDVVYHISKTRKSIQPMKITSIILHDGNIMCFGWRVEECDGFKNIYLGSIDGFRRCDLGKTVFLTRKAAEAALAAQEEDK